MRPTLVALVIPLLAGSAAAQAPKPTSRPAEAPTPARQPTVKLVRGATLPGGVAAPAAVSRDGKRLVYLKEVYDAQKRRQYVFVRCDGEGKKATEVLTTSVDAENMIRTYLHPGLFSADGKRVVLPRAVGGTIVPVVLTEGGDSVVIDTQLPVARGFGYAGDRLVVLEGHGVKAGRRGYRLMCTIGGKREPIDESKTGFAFALRPSPDGKRVAMLVLVSPSKRAVKLRVIDLATRKAIDSKPFRTDAVAFGGLASIAWDAKSAGVYYHACLGARRLPFKLMRFDLKTRAAKPVAPYENLVVTAVLDPNHLAVSWFSEFGVLRISDGALFPFDADHGRYAVGGRGKRVVLLGLDPKTGKRSLTVADFTLPKANPTGKE